METRVILNAGDFGLSVIVNGTQHIGKETDMIIGDRLRALREQKKLPQGDIEKRTGLFRCYISRVENGHTVPGVETLEKMALALGVPLYQIFYDGEESLKLPVSLLRKKGDHMSWGDSGKDSRTLSTFRGLLKRISESDRKLLEFMAQKMYQQSNLRAKT